MRTVPRNLLRLIALLLTLAVLLGVPFVLVRTVGVPLPSAESWRAAWTTRRVDTDFVVRVGAAVFVVLWLWFAATAVGELWRVFPHRHEPAMCAPPSASDGPSAWVRGLVRFIAVSSMTATVVAGSVSAVAGGASARAGAPTVARQAATVPFDASRADGHVVVAGDSYWGIAEHHLAATLGREASPREVMTLTHLLVDTNSPRLGHRDPTLIVPGETVVVPGSTVLPPPVAPAPAPAVPVSAPTDPTVDSTQVSAPEVVVAPVAQPVAPPVAAPVATSVTTPVATPVATSVATSPSTPVTVNVAEPPAPTLPSDVVADVMSGISDGGPGAVSLGLGSAVMLSVGALGALNAHRRRRLRAGLVGTRLEAPTFERARTELMLRAVSDEERLARLDLVVRRASRGLAAQGASVLAAVVSDAGDVRLVLRGAATPGDPSWRLDILGGTWTVPGAIELAELAHGATGLAQPCPALLHLGAVDDGELFADLEAMGVLAVDSAGADDILRAAASSLALSPFREAARVVVAGVAVPPELAEIERAPSAADALLAAGMACAAVAQAGRGRGTFALRAESPSGEAWEPTIAVVLAGAGVDASLLDAIEPGSGAAAMIAGCSVDTPYRVRADGDRHVLEPFGLRFRPTGVTMEQLDAITELVVAETQPLEVVAPPVLVEHVGEVASVGHDWDLMVRMLGPVDVVSRDGLRVEFERSKALELVVWLSLHRERPTRTSARSALWDLDVRDSTFANVVSEARRAMARVLPPPHGDDWVGRTLTDALPLHSRIVTDVDELLQRVEAARALSALDAIEVLRPGVELIRGMPFAGTSFLWADAGGHASALVLAATGAAIELAERHLSVGDIDGVFWATGRGLSVLPGHEELIALRMRAHARRGDLAAVRQEWESYERALAADSWSAGEPAPKLIALRRELLAAPLGAARGA